MTEDKAFDEIISLIRTKISYDCSQYKVKCLKRRINVRIRATNSINYLGYLNYLKTNPQEFSELADSLTINVTRFFRNKTVFDIIDNTIFDSILQNKIKKRSRILNIWSAGCSSGEEPYSLAIIAHQFLQRKNLVGKITIRILGTDIDRASLEKAKIGIYPETAFEETPSEIVETYFSPLPNYRRKHYQICNTIKKNVRFSYLNLVTERPKLYFDLILCRNVLIYFNRDLQQHVFKTLVDSLNSGGYIVLGKTETLIGFSFQPNVISFDKRERIYYKQ